MFRNPNNEKIIKENLSDIIDAISEMRIGYQNVEALIAGSYSEQTLHELVLTYTDPDIIKKAESLISSRLGKMIIDKKGE
jgi:hypothetical protein